MAAPSLSGCTLIVTTFRFQGGSSSVGCPLVGRRRFRRLRGMASSSPLSSDESLTWSPDRRPAGAGAGTSREDVALVLPSAPLMLQADPAWRKMQLAHDRAILRSASRRCGSSCISCGMRTQELNGGGTRRQLVHHGFHSIPVMKMRTEMS